MKQVLICLILVLFVIPGCKPQADKDFKEVDLLLDNERYSDALLTADRYVKKYPQDAGFYYLRGWSYLRLHDLNNAQNDFELCTKVDPTYANGYKGLACIYQEKGIFDLAEKNYEKALELATTSERKSSIYENMANMYLYYRKDYRKAINLYLQAIELNDSGNLYKDLGRAYYKIHQKKKAEEVWLKAVNEKNFNGTYFKRGTYYFLALYYLETKEYQKSKENILKAIELSPNNNQYLTFYKKLKRYIP